MVNVLASIAIYRGFDHRSRKSKDYIKLIIVVSLLSIHLQGGRIISSVELRFNQNSELWISSWVAPNDLFNKI
jgi:hypothetical protein